MVRLKQLLRYRVGEAGHSLVGLALMIVVVGVAAASGLMIAKNYGWQQKQQATAKNLENIKEALLSYQKRVGHYPCPASMIAGLDAANFGVQAAVDCAAGPNPNPAVDGTRRNSGRGGLMVRTGTVPVRTLNLPDSNVIDGWGHRILYSVTEIYASPGANFDEDRGAIQINDHSNDPMTGVPGHVIYALISSGQDKRGSYNLAGIEVLPCDTTASIASGNCFSDNNPNWRSSMYKQIDIGTNDYTSTVAYSASMKSYKMDVTPWSLCGACPPPENTTLSGAADLKEKKNRSVSCLEKGTNNVVNKNTYCAHLGNVTTQEDCLPVRFCPTYKCPTQCHDTDVYHTDEKCITNGPKYTNASDCTFPTGKVCAAKPCRYIARIDFPNCPTQCSSSGGRQQLTGTRKCIKEEDNSTVSNSLCNFNGLSTTRTCHIQRCTTGGGANDGDGDGSTDSHS